MSRKRDKILIEVAQTIAKLSSCKRLQVGAIITDEQGHIISTGYNGTPSGHYTNDCECNGKTKEYVIHAEMNALLCAAKLGVSVNNCIMYCTHAPCIRCAPSIVQAGIKEVVYLNDYENDGIDLLKSLNIYILNINEL